MLALCALVLAGSSWSQTLTFGLSAGSSWQRSAWRLRPELSADTLAFGDDRLSLALAGGLGEPLRVQLAGRSTQSFGPAGNVIFRGQGSFDTDANFEVALGGSGVLGPVAGEATLALFGVGARPPSPFPLNDERRALLDPDRADLGFGLELSARYRVSRTFIVTLESEAYLTASRGFAGRVRAEAWLVRHLDPDDLRVLGEGFLGPGGRDGYGALGLEYDLNRRGLPDLRASLWLGLGSAGLWPGARLAAGFTADAGRFELALAAEPYRSDRAPYRARASADLPWGSGHLLGETELQLREGALAAAVSLRYQLPLQRP